MSVVPFDGHLIAPETASFLNGRHRLLIDGDWHDGAAGETLETRDPATGLALVRVQIGGGVAVGAARRAFEGPWGRMTVADRTAAMFRLARIVEANAPMLAELEVIDNGMPMFIAALTVANCVEMIDYYAGAIMRIEGTTTAPPRHVAAEAEALTYTLREPVGVAGQIVPWNVPLSTAILKLAPALAAGCTVVMKPSEETPLTILALGRMILDAGFPAGVVNIVNGRGADAINVNFSGSINDSSINRYQNAQVTQLTGITDFSGRENPNTSKYSAAVGAQYNGTIGNVDWFLRADYNYKSGLWADASNTVRTADLHIVNMRAGADVGNVSISAFVRNLFNNHTYTSIANSSILTNNFRYSTYFSGLVVGLPELRTFGVEMKYRY